MPSRGLVVSIQANALNLALVAHSARHALEQYSSVSTDLMFERFPRGACGATSELIGRYLSEVYQLRGKLVSGLKSDGSTHIWLSFHGIILDITADQFGQSAVIVSRKSAWHEAWETGEDEHPDAHQVDWPTYLEPAWQALVAGLVRANFQSPASATVVAETIAPSVPQVISG